MKHRKLTIFFIAFLMLSLLASLTANSRAAEESGSAIKKLVATIDDDGVQRLEIIGGEYYFEPNHIIVQVNKPVELLVSKTGGFIPHNIIINAPEAGINFDVGMGKKSKPIRFTPTRTGKYPIYCDKRFLWFKTHQDKGMEGVLEVVE